MPMRTAAPLIDPPMMAPLLVVLVPAPVAGALVWVTVSSGAPSEDVASAVVFGISMVEEGSVVDEDEDEDVVDEEEDDERVESEAENIDDDEAGGKGTDVDGGGSAAEDVGGVVSDELE